MKRGCLGCFLFVPLLLVALFAGWVSYPPARHKAAIEQASQRYAARSAEQLKRAQDKSQNGLFEPRFYDWWGPKSVRKDPPAAAAPIAAWNKYSEAAQGEPVDHRGLLARRDQDYLKARAAFAKDLPALLRAFNRPVFAADKQLGLDDEGEQINFLALRSIVQALTAYGVSLSFEGKTDEGVLAILPALQLGRHLMGDRLNTDMIGVALQAIAENGILSCLQAGRIRDEQTWRKITQTVQDSLSPAHEMAWAVEGDVAVAQDAFEHPQNVPELQPYTRIPGLLPREVRRYNNDMAELLQSAQAQEVVTIDPQRVRWSAGNWLLGRVGLLSSSMLSSYGRASEQLALGRRRLVVLHTLAALELYHQKRKAYPNQLAQLAEVGLQPLPGFDWSTANFAYQKTGSGAECQLLLSPDLSQRFGAMLSHDTLMKQTPEGIRVPLPDATRP